MPEVEVYPVCIAPRSKTDPTLCEVPWVLRRCLSLISGEYHWLWQKDCKHKNAECRMEHTGG